MKNPGMKAPLVLGAEAIFDLESAAKALGLTKPTLLREVRLKRLRVSRRAGRYFTLGSWLLQWLQDEEARRRKRETATELNGQN